jgi:hypothetical protein
MWEQLLSLTVDCGNGYNSEEKLERVFVSLFTSSQPSPQQQQDQSQGQSQSQSQYRTVIVGPVNARCSQPSPQQQQDQSQGQSQSQSQYRTVIVGPVNARCIIENVRTKGINIIVQSSKERATQKKSVKLRYVSTSV